MTTYTLKLSNMPNTPHDVLVEHLGHALRTLSIRRRPPRITVLEGPNGGREHPFDGPEVFDDATQPRLPLDPEELVEYQAGPMITEDNAADLNRAISEDFPRLAELMKVKREQPPAEGDWTLDPGEAHD